MKLPKNFGTLVLAIWLIVVGLEQLIGLSLGSLNIIVPILALVAGVLLLLGR